ncbi:MULTISPECIES: hypothetical protein [Gordonibacter]|uniref:Type II toxin-antitoxin system death-on-curing family toxin n=1 Tax=Gordonibacter faecis TaxID=3047475 RepID=A0ABT7DPI2_9ACTN|nr:MULTISPECIES: hypothetical protein [unclassified Gordonibacter]MDJ1651462.1 hypothetical protein [Gordonibacter sp. KGMB12511]HIW76054.1 hypothetical protein [Candidatus Gordonibacter avicola]
MPRTTVTTPTRDDLINMNRLTQDGTGEVFKDEDLDDIVSLNNAAFDYYIDDINDTTSIGIVFAHLIGSGHIFTDGNKSTGTRAFKWILAHNDKELNPDLSEEALIEIINDLVEVDDPAEAVQAAIEKVAPYVREVDL